MRALRPRRAKIVDPRLDSLARLLQRSYAQRGSVNAGVEVYRGSMRLFLRLAQDPVIQQDLFAAACAQARTFVAESRAHLAAPEQMLVSHLAADLWKLVWRNVLASAGRAEFDALCRVRGADHLERARAHGRGVVFAHAHTVATQLFWAWLKHLGIEAGITIWQWSWSIDAEHGGQRDPKVRVLAAARELHAAAGLLRAGGLVHVLADGFQGGRPIELPFFGRRRRFATGFAELALRSHAPVLAAFVSVGDDGGVGIDIEPLAAAEAADAPALVREYAAWLSRKWRDHAANLPWKNLTKQLKQPLLDALAVQGQARALQRQDRLK
jgi:hypothetical protein